MMECCQNTMKFGIDVKLSSEPIYDGSYIKTKVKTFSEVVKTLFDEG